MVGYEAVTVGHNRQTGELDLEDFKAKLDDDCAAIMMTVPNTLGLFERNIVEICRLAHEVGCYVYCDGANMNAMVGQVRPGDLGVDLLHINLHKTFAVPHGGGGRRRPDLRHQRAGTVPAGADRHARRGWRLWL